MNYIKNTMSPLVLTVALLASTPAALVGRADSETQPIRIINGQLLYEIVGQVINQTPSTSTQFGYFTHIKGIDTLFASSPANEASAYFTFYREVSNVLVNANGPLRTISREGTTAVYINPTPSASFGDPASFKAGTPIQVSQVHQQVVVDTVTGLFTVHNQDTITSTSQFLLNGIPTQIGKVGDVYATTKTGHLNTAGAVPAGWFSGYALGAGKQSIPPEAADR